MDDATIVPIEVAARILAPAAAAEAQLPPFLPPAPYVGAVGAGEAWLRVV